MVNFFYGLLLFIFLGGFFSAYEVSGKSYEGYKLLKLQLKNQNQIDYINNWVDENNEDAKILSSATTDKYISIIISKVIGDEFLQILKSFKVQYELQSDNIGKYLNRITKENDLLKTRLRTRSSTVNSIAGYYARFEEIQSWQQSLVNSYPSLIQLINIGKSIEGRSLNVLKINSGSSGKPIIFIDGGLHAREWLSPASLIYAISKLVNGAQNGDVEAKRILDKYEIHALVVANPDGYEFSFTNDRYWRKNRRRVSGSCVGVDLNRNFDAAWGTTGVSSNCRSDIYPGTQAFSEPETKSLGDYVMKIRSQTKLYLTLHTFGEFWFIPYGYARRTRPSDFTELERVAKLGADAILKNSGRRWKVGSAADLLYESSGGSDDWAKLKTGIKYSYCLELRPADSNGLEGFSPPASQIKPSGEELFSALSALAEHMK